jgi:hypothetical protein
MRIIPQSYYPSRPCSAILRSCYGESDFRGDLTLENGHFYRVYVRVAIDHSRALDCLHVCFRPALGKTPVGPYQEAAHRYSVVVRRNSKERSDESDFKASLILEGRIYELGIYVCSSLVAEEYLRLYLRPLLSKTPGTSSALEVVHHD